MQSRSLLTITQLTNAIASEGASPFIRVPWSEEWMIKRALDSGAHGIVTPMCHTEVSATKKYRKPTLNRSRSSFNFENQDDAARIVKYSKYPPVGSRGYGPSFAPHAFPGLPPGKQYDEGAEKGLMVVVQIESRSGVENSEKIASVPGVDVLFIG